MFWRLASIVLQLSGFSNWPIAKTKKTTHGENQIIKFSDELKMNTVESPEFQKTTND